MNIAAYCRVSTEKDDQLNSLENQIKFFTEYTNRTGDTLVHVYADEGISGTKTRNRKEFQRMMADAEDGLFEMVVVKDISRFARNTVDFLQNIRKLKAIGIETQFLTANMTNMGSSEFVLTIFGALAQEESANTSKRVKFGKRINAEKGRVPNRVFGYDKTIGEYFDLTINETEADIVRQIFHWYTQEGYGSQKIANMLNDRGLTTKRGCKWNKVGICGILSNELYVGRLINGKTEVTDFLTGRHEKKDKSQWLIAERPNLQIIDEETFQRAQQIKSSRAAEFQLDSRQHSNTHLFSTLIYCKECGHSFHRTVRTFKKTYIRWGCSGHTNNGAASCPNKLHIDEKELIDTLQTYFSELLSKKQHVMQSINQEYAKAFGSNDESQSKLQVLNAQLDKIQRTRQKYMNMYTDDLLSREELGSLLHGMKEEKELLEKELSTVTKQISSTGNLESILKNTFQAIEDVVDVRQMNNAQLKQIIEKIVVDKDGNADIYLRRKLGMNSRVS